MGKWRYGVILDAGSSGTRVYVYRWLDNVRARQDDDPGRLQSLPKIKTKEDWTKKIHPGVSSFASKPEQVGPDHLDGLLQHALSIVPEDAVKETPIFLLATAGMRLLKNAEQQLLLERVCSYIRSNSDFLLPDCDLHIQVIPGETEGLYGWIATNYLLGSFDSPAEHDHGKDHHTYGFLDMGGASAQIAFAPNATEAEKHANDLKLLRLRNVDGSSREYKVFVTSWLEFGVHEARNRYIKALQAASGAEGIKELPDPCLPNQLRTTLDGEIVSSTTEPKTYLLGTGKFDECLRQTYTLLDKDAPCPDQPCLLHGVHVPAIDFDVNHFIGISEFWHTTHGIFEIEYQDKAYDFNTYQQRVKEFCSQDWGSIEKSISDHKLGGIDDQKSAYELCFKASWIINMLHDGIGIPRVGLEDTKGSGHNGTKEVLSQGKNKGFIAPFHPANKIHGTEVSWTLGKAVLYASSQVPPADGDALPVGFGSNMPGVPGDFQYPSVDRLAKPDEAKEEGHGEHWHDALFAGDSPRRIPGILLFIFIIIITLYFLCGRTRRQRIYRKLGTLFHRRGPSHHHHHKKSGFLGGKLSFTRRNPPSYERVLEDGAHEFELGNIESDDSEHESERHSDSGSPSGRGPKRASEWGSTPTLTFGFDNGSSGNVGLGINNLPSNDNNMDRTGLVVRTESRDHLSTIALGPTTNGRRSRATSPARANRMSPIMTPLADD
ncbi:hypothetical protein VTN02DRAFT_3928 [Thermoascus thermophilus]